MSPFSTRVVPSLAVALFLACTLTTVLASDRATLSLYLENTGVDPDAKALLTASLGPVASSLSVRAIRLTPGAVYTLTANGLTHATAKASPSGGVHFLFANPQTPYSRLLPFDPRGSTLALLNPDGAPVLQAVVAALGEPPASSLLDRTALPRKSGPARQSALAQYALTHGEHRFDLLLQNVTGSNWWLYVDGAPRAEINIQRGVGRLKFRDHPQSSTETHLAFDPRQRLIDIAQGSNLVFSGKMEARAKNLNFASPSVRPGVIPSTGLDPDALAAARSRVNRDASREFKLELQHLPVGAYELLADGSPVAIIQVIDTPRGSEGEIQFAANSDDPHKLPLTFDPAKADFLIRQGPDVFFQGKITSRVPALAGGSDPVQLEEPLTSAGLHPHAHAQATFQIRDDARRKFNVEIEDLPAGTYELRVGGVLRARFPAQLINGRVQGEVNFSTNSDDPHELPLPFDPRGQLLQISSTAGTFFTHLFGTGQPGADCCAPLNIQLPLFHLASTPTGRAQASFQRDDRGRRHFEVELEHAPLGDYSLLVGGLLQGTITVSLVDGHAHGQIQFEDEPSLNQAELTFDPLGHLISISRDGTTLFERTLPNS